MMLETIEAKQRVLREHMVREKKSVNEAIAAVQQRTGDETTIGVKVPPMLRQRVRNLAQRNGISYSEAMLACAMVGAPLMEKHGES